MNIIKNISLTFLLLMLIAFKPAIAGSNYVIDNENSVVSFAVTKVQYIMDPAVFQDVAGTIDEQGNVIIKIDINSVNSDLPIRDSRLIDLFFHAEFFPEAIVTAQIDTTVLNSKETLQQIELEASIEFYDTIKDITLHLLVVKTGDKIVVTSLKPTIIKAQDFGMPPENLEALSQVCNNIAVAGVVPVNFVLTFIKQTDI